jgi:hypothetical protein
MNDQMHSEREGSLVGEQLKREFSGLDPFIPPAIPFEQIEGSVRRTPAGSAPRRATAPRARSNAGASLALVGLVAIVVLVFGVRMLGPKGDLGPAASPSGSVAETTFRLEPSPGCSIVPVGASAACGSPAAASPAVAPTAIASQPVFGGEPAIIFSATGGNASWNPSGTRAVFSAGDGKSPIYSKIVDASGHTIETVQAAYVIWAGDDTYLGLNANADYISYHAFVGHVGSPAQQALPGTYYADPLGRTVVAGGSVALPTSLNHDQYVVWTATGLSATRSGNPIAFSRDGRLLAVVQSGSVRVVRTDDGLPVASYGSTDEFDVVLGFSPDGGKLAIVDSQSLVILDVASGQASPIAGCPTQSVVWTSSSSLIVSSPGPCRAPAGSGLKVETARSLRGSDVNVNFAMFMSSTGRIAWASGSGDDPNVILRIDIDDGAGGRESISFKGSRVYLAVSWSADGSTLMVEYLGPGTSNPPSTVIFIRP